MKQNHLLSLAWLLHLSYILTMVRLRLSSLKKKTVKLLLDIIYCSEILRMSGPVQYRLRDKLIHDKCSGDVITQTALNRATKTMKYECDLPSAFGIVNMTIACISATNRSTVPGSKG